MNTFNTSISALVALTLATSTAIAVPNPSNCVCVSPFDCPCALDLKNSEGAFETAKEVDVPTIMELLGCEIEVKIKCTG